jgi:hypothetical protein
MRGPVGWGAFNAVLNHCNDVQNHCNDVLKTPSEVWGATTGIQYFMGNSWKYTAVQH